MSMKMKDIYKLAIEEAMKADPRSSAALEEGFTSVRERFEKLDPKDKERFDVDSLWNPYYDSRILYGDPETEITSLLWGIDITTGEVILADRLREKGKRIDAIVGHHPRGKASAALHRVMHVQEDIMSSWGVPINVAEDLMVPRIREVMTGSHSSNHDQAVDACRLLDIPFMCLHCAPDMLVQRYIQDMMDEKGPKRLKDIIDILSDVPEYDAAIRDNNPPEIFVGDRSKSAGKIVVKMAGGTSAPKEMYQQIAAAGVGTVICMHVPDSHIEEARKNHVNIVIASHMASDSLGCNLMADKFEERGVSILSCSGFIRVSRN